MIFARLIPLVTRGLLLTGLVLASVLCSQERASASCGDWLADHPSGGSAKEFAAAGTSSDENAPAESQPARCTGPSCGQAPAAPLLPAPARVPTDSQEHGVTIADAGEDAARLAFGRQSGDERLSYWVMPSRIDRPPRF